jgi:hypothetical protein
MCSKVLFQLTTEDVQNIALKRIGRKLMDDELYRVQKGIEFGLECWEDVVKAAIDEVGYNKKRR